jgi:TRAP-type C4-dicarboxylate transport system permease small subunit
MTLLERPAAWTVALGGIGILLSMFLGVGDVVGSLLNRPVVGAREVTESTLILIVFGGLTYAQIRRRHIRVELFYYRAGPRLRSIMDIIAAISGLTYFGLLIWQGWNEALYSWQIDEATFGLIRFPLYPARFLLVAGTALMMAQLFIDLWRDIREFGNPRDYDLI